MIYQNYSSKDNYYSSVNSFINLKNVLTCLPKSVTRVASIFNNFLKMIYRKIHYAHRKLYAIYLNEIRTRISPGHLSGIVCQTINIAKKSVIWREEDLCKTKEFINLISNPKYSQAKGISALNLEDLNKLREYPIEGAVTNGICFGSSLWIIKSLLKNEVNSEAELIQFSRQYKDGFPAEAAALQNLHRALIGYDSELSLKEQEALNRVLSEEQAKGRIELEQEKLHLKDRLKGLSLEEAKRIVQTEVIDARAAIDRKIMTLKAKLTEMHLYKDKADKLNYVSAAIDLKLKKHPIEKCHKVNFTGILTNQEKNNKFNILKNGYYQVLFKVGDKGGHSIVYIKKEFGSYFLDPNYGLIKCAPNASVEKLCELLKMYKGRPIENGEREHFLEVHRYQ